MNKIFLILLISLNLFSVSITRENRKRVLCVGDSITEGTGSTALGGYRFGLQDSMGVSNYLFLGRYTYTSSSKDCYYSATYGVGHDGWYGGRTTNILSILNTDLDAYMTDSSSGSIAIVMIGTNDVSANTATNTIVSNVETMIDQIDAHDSDIDVYVCSVCPRTDSKDSNTTTYNTALETMVGNYVKTNLYFVDINSAFKANASWASAYMYDTLHPNADGYEVISDTLYASINS